MTEATPIHKEPSENENLLILDDLNVANPDKQTNQPKDTQVEKNLKIEDFERKDLINGPLKRVAKLFSYLSKNHGTWTLESGTPVVLVQSDNRELNAIREENDKFRTLYNSIINGVGHPYFKSTELLAIYEPKRTLKPLERYIPFRGNSESSANTYQTQIESVVQANEQPAFYQKLKELDLLLKNKTIRSKFYIGERVFGRHAGQNKYKIAYF